MLKIRLLLICNPIVKLILIDRKTEESYAMLFTAVWVSDSLTVNTVLHSNSQSHIYWHTHVCNYSLAASTDAKLYAMLCTTGKERGFPTKHIKT